MTSRLGIEVRDDRVDWAVLHRTLRGPMRVASGSIVAAVGVDETGRLVAGPQDGHPAVRDRVDQLPGRLGGTAPLILDGVPYGAERLLAVVVAAAAAAASREAGDAPLHTVLVHPDGLDQLRRDLLTETARRAAIAGEWSLAPVSEAAAAALRSPLGGPGSTTAIGGAQLAWERRPDDDHLGAAAGAAGGAAIVGGAAVLGSEGAVASASSAAAGPVGVPLTAASPGPAGAPLAPAAGGPTGTPLSPAAPGPAGTPLAPSTPGPAGTPVTPGAPGPAGTPLTPATPGPVGAPLPTAGAPEVPVDGADHTTGGGRRKRLRPRGRVIAAGTAAVVVIGAGVAIVANAGDNGPAARVTAAQEGVGTDADGATAGSAASLPVVTLPTDSIVPTTTDGATPSTVAPSTTAVSPTTMPAGAGACPVGVWRLDDQSAMLLIQDAFDAEGEPGSVSFVGGSMDISIGADGSWSTTWNDWTWQVQDPDLGTVTIGWDGASAGSVAVQSTTLDITETSGAITTTIGGPFPMSVPSDGMFTGSATYVCTGGTLSVQFPENDRPFVMVPAS